MATEAQSDVTKIIALGGSLKMEVRVFTSVSDGDTFVSKLATPSFALAFSTADAGGTTTNMSATVSSKTITIQDPATTSVAVIVFGT